MDVYEQLAQTLLEELDRRKKGPPPGEISAAMRGEMAVLRLLFEEGAPLSAGDISRLLRMTTSRIAAVLGSLKKKGLILRETDEGDKRRVLVTLTDKGEALCKKRKQAMLAQLADTLRQLGEADAAHFVRIMGRLHDILPPPPPCGALADDDEKEACSLE